MASYIKKGESILIPFRNGISITDSQLRPRMYKTVQAFEKSFPSHYLGNNGLELVEYVEVVRCKDCKHSGINENHPNKPLLCYLTRMCGSVDPGWYCWQGERKDNEN